MSRKNKKKSKASRGLHAAAARYRFIKQQERRGKTRKQAERVWKTAQKIKQRAMRKCSIQVAKEANRHLREAGVKITTGGEFVPLGGKGEAKARAGHAYASTLPSWHTGSASYVSGDKRGKRGKRGKKGKRGKLKAWSRRAHRSTGKKAGRRHVSYKVRGKSRWVRFAAPRMKKSMRAISVHYKTGKPQKVLLDPAFDFDPRRKKSKVRRKKTKAPRKQVGTRARKLFIAKCRKQGHSYKAALKKWGKHVRALKKRRHWRDFDLSSDMSGDRRGRRRRRGSSRRRLSSRRRRGRRDPY